MKKLFIALTLVCGLSLFTISCTKQNDAGIQIDGNGGARPANSMHIQGNDSTLNGYGIAIDPDGRY